MNRIREKYCFIFLLSAVIAVAVQSVAAQKVEWYASTDNDFWHRSNIRMKGAVKNVPRVIVTAGTTGHKFKHWGTTFNELDWDAFKMLDTDERNRLMHNLFAPDGELKFTRGRIGMNCNDYGRSWFSCDEVAGDFELRYFNIERDKQGIIPLIHAAQKYNPALTFWTSPWSPPSWMKINHDYPVVSSRYNNADARVDYLLYGVTDSIDEDEMKFLGERRGEFPRRLATQDYFIQDPRYLQAYANYFCKFIDAYAEQGVSIDMVIYQNEAYSYTPYPGCPWTAEGTIRFNRDYLAPTLRRKHPGVKLYLGTFNTNRRDHVEKVLSDSLLRSQISGLGFQWEGREIMPYIRRRYPDFSYICSESECGDGSMDWRAAEHTFFLISDNLGNGVDEWYNWNFLLPKQGESPWGWKQNALIELDSETRTIRYTPEYFAVRHFSGTVSPGAEILAYSPAGDSLLSVLVARNPDGRMIVLSSNTSGSGQRLTVKLLGRYLDVLLKPHSLNTFIVSP